MQAGLQVQHGLLELIGSDESPRGARPLVIGGLEVDRGERHHHKPGHNHCVTSAKVTVNWAVMLRPMRFMRSPASD